MPLKSIKVDWVVGMVFKAAIKQMPGAFLHMCACIGTQPWAFIDMHSHTHKIQKSKDSV